MKNKKIIGALFLSSALLMLGACTKKEESGKIEAESGEEVVVSNSSEEVVVGDEKIKDDGYFKDIVKDGVDPEVKDIVSYDTNYENKDWDNIKFVIDHVKIVNVDKYKDDKDDKFKTLLSMRYKLYNEKSDEKHIEPERAYLVLKDGKKVEASFFRDTWDDEVLTHDKHKDGYLHFKVKDEQKLNDIKSVEIEFKADKDQVHKYTIDLPVSPEE